MIIPGAESFYIPGGPVGCLLVHGLTGTPKEMRWMGEFLSEKGHTILGIRLAGHATQPKNLVRTRWYDWLASVQDGYDLLRGSTDSIFVMGLSLGGILSILISTQKQVEGVVAISTLMILPKDPRLPFAKYLTWLKPSVEKGLPDWRNLEAASEHIEYPNYPTRAIAELREVVLATRAVLPQVTVPILLVHSRDDASVPPENTEYIYDHISSLDKQILWVENCGHVVIREPQRMRVFQATDEFIRRVMDKSR